MIYKWCGVLCVLLWNVLLTAAAAGKDKGEYCNGLEDCGCFVEYGTIRSCSVNVGILYLHGANEVVTGIANGAFNSAPNAKEIHLSGNHITWLGKDAFKGLYNLEYLFLSDNNIQEIDDDAFSALPKLAHLCVH